MELCALRASQRACSSGTPRPGRPQAAPPSACVAPNRLTPDCAAGDPGPAAAAELRSLQPAWPSHACAGAVRAMGAGGHASAALRACKERRRQRGPVRPPHACGRSRPAFPQRPWATAAMGASPHARQAAGARRSLRWFVASACVPVRLRLTFPAGARRLLDCVSGAARGGAVGRGPARPARPRPTNAYNVRLRRPAAAPLQSALPPLGRLAGVGARCFPGRRPPPPPACSGRERENSRSCATRRGERGALLLRKGGPGGRSCRRQAAVAAALAAPLESGSTGPRGPRSALVAPGQPVPIRPAHP